MTDYNVTDDNLVERSRQVTRGICLFLDRADKKHFELFKKCLREAMEE